MKKLQAGVALSPEEVARLAQQAREHMTNVPDGHIPWPEGLRSCICADPENCREPIPGRACKARNTEQWAL